MRIAYLLIKFCKSFPSTNSDHKRNPLLQNAHLNTEKHQDTLLMLEKGKNVLKILNLKTFYKNRSNLNSDIKKFEFLKHHWFRTIKIHSSGVLETSLSRQLYS